MQLEWGVACDEHATLLPESMRFRKMRFEWGVACDDHATPPPEGLRTDRGGGLHRACYLPPEGLRMERGGGLDRACYPPERTGMFIHSQKHWK